MELKVNTAELIDELLAQEDTDGDKKITVEDNGPKSFTITDLKGRILTVKGTYYLSSLLTELIMAGEKSGEVAVIDSEKIFEKPVERTRRMIKDHFWDGLTRRTDAGFIHSVFTDTKMPGKNYIYIPYNDQRAYKYFRRVAKENPELELNVEKLPEQITPEYVLSLNGKHGLLSLELRDNRDGDPEGVPYVVPGGRFNEMYGWDSYFESLGLINDGRLDLAQAMADNFVYQIQHYGQILNANRSYYLTRSQPPFLTSHATAVYNHLPRTKESKKWLARIIQTAVKEYNQVWMNDHRLTTTNLSRYFDTGIGLPPETEEEHFDHILEPFAGKAGISVREYHQKYLEREVIEPEIEEFIMHDRSLRESGHDTSYRLHNVCAHLNTVDLNSLLFKYEMDIGELIKTEFKGQLLLDDDSMETAEPWFEKAEIRKEKMNELMWNEEQGFFFDYNFMTGSQTGFESATTFYPLWAGIADEYQAEIIVKKALPVLEAAGGVASTSEKSVKETMKNGPQKQWDYPNGWAPHQMIIWKGLSNYGYSEIVQRLAYKWLYTILRNAADYQGTVPEKFDVVNRTHKVFAEYGNVGTDFDYINREGFGWMNASFTVGLNYLTDTLIAQLNDLTEPKKIF